MTDILPRYNNWPMTDISTRYNNWPMTDISPRYNNWPMIVYNILLRYNDYTKDCWWKGFLIVGQPWSNWSNTTSCCRWYQCVHVYNDWCDVVLLILRQMWTCWQYGPIYGHHKYKARVCFYNLVYTSKWKQP